MIRRMLVPLDGSTLAEAVLPHAARLGKAFGAAALVLRVVGERLSDVGHYIETFDWRLKRLEADKYLERIAGSLREQGVEARWEVAVGRASEQILATARRDRSDLIVLTTHGEGGRSEFHVSGTAAKIVSPVGPSLLLVPPPRAGEAPQAASYERILVPVDCSPRADWAVRLAGSVARTTGAELVLLYISTLPEAVDASSGGSGTGALARRLRDSNREAAREHLEGMVGMLAGLGVSARPLVLESEDVALTIRRVADDESASLVAMAAHGARPGSGVPHGMVAASLLGESARPLLLLQDVPIEQASVPIDTIMRGRMASLEEL